MKFLLPFSLFTNLLLAGFVGYLLGIRTPASSIDIRPPSFAESSVEDNIPETAAPQANSRVNAAIAAVPTSTMALPVAPLPPTDEPSAVVAAPGVAFTAPSSPASFVPAASLRSSREGTASSAPATDLTATANEGIDPVSGELVRTHNPTGLGNSLAFQGVRVGLTETYDSPETADRGLGVELSADASAVPTDDSNFSEASGDVVAVAQRRDDGSNETQTPTSGRPGSVGKPPRTAHSGEGSVENDGLSYEDELFRMKWGWAAFDAARAEAKREADRLRNGG